jgi:hypothetical protein
MKSTIYPFLPKEKNEIPQGTYIIRSLIKKTSIEYDLENLLKQFHNPGLINPFTALKGISESELKDLLWIITNNIILMESDTQ